jgi:methanogenic corrinoid protein MtbC1
MVYIRSKKVKGIEYAYLVKSEWDSKNKTSRQQTIKYLGKSSEVEIEDVPEQYRVDARIAAFIAEHSPLDLDKRKIMLESVRDELFACMFEGDVRGAIGVYERCRNSLSLIDFYDKILRHVMYEIGSKWEKGEIDVVTEHVCTNVAHSLVDAINERISSSEDRGKIIIFTPDGEIHRLAASVLESILKSKGYKVFNASPSVPAESIIAYIGDINPDLVMMSVTLPENIGAGQRTVQKIRSRFSTPVLVGGSAISPESKFPGAQVMKSKDNNIEDVLRTIRGLMAASR